MRAVPVVLSALALLALAGCSDRDPTPPDPSAPEDARVSMVRGEEKLDPVAVRRGREIFRYDDFGDWRFWTDTARLNVLVEGVTPRVALALGLKVDAEAVPPAVLNTVLSTPGLLDDPAITRALLAQNAVVGVTARVEGDRITRIGISCAFCHSSVDDAVAHGIGNRRDGWPNHDLAVGTILSLLPGLPTVASSLGVSPEALRSEFQSWPAGYYDARVNLDGRFAAPPVVIPPAYGLRGVGLETYTGEGPISYWNNYVAVTQMHGHGSFFDSKLGVRIEVPAREDQVKRKLAPLRQYQFSLEAPPPPAGSFDAAAAARGRAVFEGAGRCSRCHSGPKLTDGGHLHAPSETGMEPTWAERGTTGKYRSTPLRGLWQHAPYFHDGSAATLRDVVEHYDGVLGLRLTEKQKRDLVEYLKTL
jgi:mono/diheme cytochrome c family protein